MSSLIYCLRDFINWFNYAFEQTCDKIKWDRYIPVFLLPPLYSEKIEPSGNSDWKLQAGKGRSKSILPRYLSENLCGYKFPFFCPDCDCSAYPAVILDHWVTVTLFLLLSFNLYGVRKFKLLLISKFSSLSHLSSKQVIESRFVTSFSF